MTTPEKYTAKPEEVPPAAPLGFTVTLGDSRLGIRPGERLEWDGSAPKGARISVRRVLPIHEGDLDKMMLRGVVTPDGLAILTARQRFVAQLLADRNADEQAAA